MFFSLFVVVIILLVVKLIKQCRTKKTIQDQPKTETQSEEARLHSDLEIAGQGAATAKG